MSYNYLYKLILIGEPSVGKTCICSRLSDDKFKQKYETTIGVDFSIAHVMLNNGDKIKCQLWDTAGQEAFAPIISSYYKKIAGAIVVYDITNKNTYHKIPFWLNEISKNKSSDVHYVPTIIIGNKTDCNNREVSKQDAENFAKNNNCLYIETSAQDRKNLFEAVKKLCEKINTDYLLNNSKNGVSKMPVIKHEDENKNYKDLLSEFCCRIM